MPIYIALSMTSLPTELRLEAFVVASLEYAETIGAVG